MARLSRGELGARVRLDPLSKGLPLRDRSVALRQIVLGAKPLLGESHEARTVGRLPPFVRVQIDQRQTNEVKLPCRKQQLGDTLACGIKRPTSGLTTFEQRGCA